MTIFDDAVNAGRNALDEAGDKFPDPKDLADALKKEVEKDVKQVQSALKDELEKDIQRAEKKIEERIIEAITPSRRTVFIAVGLAGGLYLMSQQRKKPRSSKPATKKPASAAAKKPAAKKLPPDEV